MGIYNDLAELSTTPPARQVPQPQQPQGKPVLAKKPSGRATTTPRHHATTVSRHHATMAPSGEKPLIERVRKAVREFGKEAATHRFTLEEKKSIADITYAYRRLGIRTSENELTRIAVNYVIDDYEENGEQSVLHKVLTALNE